MHDFLISSDLHYTNSNCNQADHPQTQLLSIQQGSNKSKNATHLSTQEFPKSSLQMLSYEVQPLKAF